MSSSKLEIEGSLEGLEGGSGEEGSSEGKAPSDFLAECLAASLRRRYGAALRYCRLILRHEPRHEAARALLPLLRTRATPSARAARTQEEDATVENVGDSSASATDSSYSACGAEQSRSEPSRLELSRSESGSEPSHLERSRSESGLEDAASDCVSELDLESELEDEPLDDLDTYTSTSASSSHEVSDSSGAACDDNGNCTAAAAAAAAHARNDNAPPPAHTTTLPLPPPHPRADFHRDTRTIALDNDLRYIKDYQLRKSCAR